ncbi:MAG: SUMF1/EgtB/PvdO family nonheme iron enzyme [Symploca sp. SIO2E9]|nr:SUMF1/EgtB/PvdO family nonheme iron enzyme [Symploca sp. SIO2E9]
MKSPLPEELTQELAKQQVERFVARFEPNYRYLACHCALPLVLTPELVNYIRVQFLLNEEVPWIAEADLLLSELCRPVGYELYAMSPQVRSNLLAQFQNREFQHKFGSNRLKSLAQLLMDYVSYLMRTYPANRQRELQAQRWAAMVYLDEHRTQAEEEIARALQELVNRGKNGQAELARLQRLIEEFRPQLSQDESLIEFARTLGIWLKGQISPHATKSYTVHRVKLSLPTPLSLFEFETFTVNHRGEEIKRKSHSAQYFIETLPNKVPLEMVYIPGGKFMMGSPEGEGYDSERPQHEVTLQPFFMGKYPVTQAQWRAIASREDLQVERELKPNPASFSNSQDSDSRPVERVSWYDAVEFCQRLSKQTGKQYRLPSEAEWEYACRAFTTTPFHFGETITDKLANYDASDTYASEPKGEYRKQTTPVGMFPPNAFGLYDMHGNVYEWCADDWHENYQGAPNDGSAWIEEDCNGNDNYSQVLRGGSWFIDPYLCRCAFRYDINIWRDVIYDNFGFRVVCVAART